jgi:hypothetical protein
MDARGFDRFGRWHKCGQLWQQFNRDGLVLQHSVGVDVHGEIDVGMTSEALCHLRRDTGLGKIGNEGLPQRVEVGVPVWSKNSNNGLIRELSVKSVI